MCNQAAKRIFGDHIIGSSYTPRLKLLSFILHLKGIASFDTLRNIHTNCTSVVEG